MSVRILVGDVREKLAELADGSVHMVVTSPPYWGLRSYLPDGHADKSLEIGSEPDYRDYLATMVSVFRADHDIRFGPSSVVETVGWEPTCAHAGENPVPAMVLDPFGGAGTVGLVAQRLGRDAVLVELNPEYARIAADRISAESMAPVAGVPVRDAADLPLFAP